MQEYSSGVHPFFIRRLTTQAGSCSLRERCCMEEERKGRRRYKRRWRNGGIEEERRRNGEAWEECACKCIAETKRRGRVRRRWKAGWVKEGEHNCDWKFFLFSKLFFCRQQFCVGAGISGPDVMYRWLPEPSLSSILLPKCHFLSPHSNIQFFPALEWDFVLFLPPYLLFVLLFSKFTCCCTFLTRILIINSPTVPDINVKPSLW